jgi:hypothetical protein
MAESNELLLTPTLESDRALKSVDLYSEENTLGGNHSQRIMEGEITVGRPLLNCIARKQSGSDLLRWDYYSVDIPFTLHRLDGDRAYELAVFQVTLKDSSSIACDLFPSEAITAETKVKKTLSVSSDFKFKYKMIDTGVGGKSDSSLEYVVLTPTVTPFGKGENQFYWEYRGFNEQSVIPGVKQAAVILQVPHGLRRISIELTYRADVTERLFGVLSRRKTKTDVIPMVWELAR